MIYANHDFTGNFLAAVGTKDQTMTKVIIIDELARLITDDKPDVIKLLRDQGINISVNENAEKIALTIAHQLRNKNQAVSKGIANMIVNRRFDSSAYKKFISADGDDEGTFWSKLGGTVKGIFGNEHFQSVASDLISSKLQKDYSKDNGDSDINTQLLLERLKANEMANRAQPGGNKVLIVVVASVAIIGFGIFIASQMAKNKSSE